MIGKIDISIIDDAIKSVNFIAECNDQPYVLVYREEVDHGDYHSTYTGILETECGLVLIKTTCSAIMYHNAAVNDIRKKMLHNILSTAVHGQGNLIEQAKRMKHGRVGKKAQG
jgi:hypothetical protein